MHHLLWGNKTILRMRSKLFLLNYEILILSSYSQLQLSYVANIMRLPKNKQYKRGE